jgi:hypothetical protein
VAEIVNLRRARKAKARQENDSVAAANRIVHGRSKAEKQRLAAEKERAERTLDGHRRDDG